MELIQEKKKFGILKVIYYDKNILDFRAGIEDCYLLELIKSFEKTRKALLRNLFLMSF